MPAGGTGDVQGMTAAPELDRLTELLEVRRGRVADALAEVVGIPRTSAEDVLVDAGVDPEIPAAAITDAEVVRLRSALA